MPKCHPEAPDAQAVVPVKVVPRRGLSRQEAARYSGVGVAKFDELVRDGQVSGPFRQRISGSSGFCESWTLPSACCAGLRKPRALPDGKT